MGLTGEKTTRVKTSGTTRSFYSRKESRTLFFQPKLTVGPTNDVYEQEADAVADKIMRMPDKEPIQSKISTLDLQRKCSACEHEEENIQRKDHTGSTSREDLSEVENVLSSEGQPLDNGTKSFMQNRFGYDFNNVRIHTNTVAAKSADSINALAYTSGNNIVFNNGQYSTGTETGKKLLAHELTHVVQQGQAVKAKRIQRQEETVEEEEPGLDTEPAQQKQGGCAASDSKHFMIRNFTNFEFTVPSGCRATVTFTAIWVPVGESVDCCTGADTYSVTRNGGTARNLPTGANICGDNAQHTPRTGTITTGSGRQRFRVSVNRSGCEGIALDLSVLIRIR